MNPEPVAMRRSWIFPVFLASGLAFGASFDCARTTTPQEKAICGSPELSAADDRMAAAYTKTLATTPPELADAVRDDQRAWLKLIPLYCPVQGRPADQSMADCLRQVYAERMKTLDKLVFRQGEVTFVLRTATLIAREERDAELGHFPERMPGYGTLTVSWPVASAPGPEWKAWNQAIENAVRRMNVKAGPNSADSPAPPPLAAEQFQDVDISAIVETVEPNLVTAFVDYWSWRGAHPAEHSIQLNWLLQEQRELQPQDVFRPGSGWEDFLYQRCDADLHKNLDGPEQHDYTKWLEPGVVTAALHEIVAGSRNWKIGTQGIEIVYQDYAVAPRLFHPAPTRMPWNDLKPYLKPNFTPPQTSAPQN